MSPAPSKVLRGGLALGLLLVCRSQNLDVSITSGVVRGHLVEGESARSPPCKPEPPRPPCPPKARSTHLLTLAGDVWEFKGIPYAEPPLGQLRFSDPRALASLGGSGVYEADKDFAGCPQTCDLPPGNCPTATSEDCLFLSVWTPKDATSCELLTSRTLGKHCS
jgi:hypothetical protein